MTAIADCEDCAWREPAEDLLEASDLAERHEAKEMHDVDVDRVATDGGPHVPELCEWDYNAVIHGADVDADCLALTGTGKPCSYNAYQSNDLPVCNTHADVDDPDIVVDAHQWARISDGNQGPVTVCVNCEEVWFGHEPEVAVACPECEAVHGERCKDETSTFAAPLPPHPSRRKRAYETLEGYEPCEANPAGDQGQKVLTDGGEHLLDEDDVILSIHIADGEGGSTDFGFGVTTSRHLVRTINAGLRVDEVFERLPDNKRDTIRAFADALGDAASKQAQTDGGRAVHAVQQLRGVGDQGLCPNGSRDCPDEHGLPCSDCFLGGDHGE
ncbi:zinc finger domain-containing protein [Haloarcula sp. GH36]|uniref:zinc finger domain-containing protein n=1 Tax=Haloarcula montana TaxID=3111776 RepID=UPI002D77EB8A|nr:hypothetical protein [Haloarcula sp. GH36]